METRNRTIASGLAALLLAACSSPLAAEEIYLHGGTRKMAMVEAITAAGKVSLRLPNGKTEDIDLREVISITFRGREPRAIRAGAQEFYFVNGDRLMGQIVGTTAKDLVQIQCPTVGAMEAPLRSLTGLLTMPVEGKPGRRAMELVFGDEDEPTTFMDQIYDRRAASYEGVIEDITDKMLNLDHERLTQTVPLPILYLAGVRLAAATRDPRPELPSDAFVKLRTRDNSAIDGRINQVRHGKWQVHPMWEPGKLLPVLVEEVTEVEVLNGHAIYLSQLLPERVKEETILAPKQRYQINRNCMGNEMTIAGNSYAWGIGVHANSELTFKIANGWSTFEAAIGIDDQVGPGGSAIFKVFGDGKELFVSPVIRGSDKAPVQISVPIKGVKELTLKVEATDDLDLGDAADWAAARLVR